MNANENVVKLSDITLDKALSYKKELLTSGLVQDKDFIWKWHSALEGERWVEFEFIQPGAALFYKLKWE